MRRKLKDKNWHYLTIRIRKLVVQYKNGFMTSNEPTYFLVTLEDGYSKTMFRADSVTELFKKIKEEGRIYL